MRNVWICIFLILLFTIPGYAEAKSGCCSWHGGVCTFKCANDGVGYRCCDGTALSSKCVPYYPQCQIPKKDKGANWTYFLLGGLIIFWITEELITCYKETRNPPKFKWCKNCKYYKKVNQWSLNFSHCKNMPDSSRIPCKKIGKTKDIWKKYFKTKPDYRKLFPDYCPKWKQEKSFLSNLKKRWWLN